MTAQNESTGARPLRVERTTDRDLVVTRDFAAPARLVFEAWTRPELLERWWAPRAFGLSFLACEADVRPGGAYRFVFAHAGSSEPLTFFGRYLEVAPPRRLVWTNEEGGEEGQVTTVTFEELGGLTRVVVHDRFPTKAALDAEIASGGAAEGFRETFRQLDELLDAAPASAGEGG